MKIETSKKDGAVIVALSGEIVSRDDQHVVTTRVDEHLAAGERTIVLDLSKVPYIGSLGIAALVAVHVKVGRVGGTLRMVNPKPRVADILKITKVSGVFQTYANVEEALTAGTTQ